MIESVLITYHEHGDQSTKEGDREKRGEERCDTHADVDVMQ